MLNRENFTEELKYLVNIDSGTYVREGVNRMGQWFADKFVSMNWPVEWYEPDPKNLGRSFLTYSYNKDYFDLLILCHLDTVFPEGEVKKRPFSINSTKFYGPGVADMKSGLLFTYMALKELQTENKISSNIGVFFNNEHEITCPNTRKLIEEFSLKSRIAITPEPARANGAYVNRRKGIGRYKVFIHGKSAHSGVNPEDGVDAVNELAHWVLFLKKLNIPEEGVYVNSGIVKGGMSINSIPGEAELHIDTRFFNLKSGDRVDEKIRNKALNPFNSRIKIELEGGVMRPPMIPTKKTEQLCKIVESIGKQYGINVSWATSGGGSDASFSAALGIPSLCGLAAVGGNLHSEEEFLETKDIESRFEVYKELIYQFSNPQLKLI